jgi:hypothetical protein
LRFRDCRRASADLRRKQSPRYGVVRGSLCDKISLSRSVGYRISLQKANTLNSWKEIASYLGRGVRTVQSWELELNLPVYRVGSTNRSPVFAFRSELDGWLRKQAGLSRQAAHVVIEPGKPEWPENRLSIVGRDQLD